MSRSERQYYLDNNFQILIVYYRPSTSTLLGTSYKLSHLNCINKTESKYHHHCFTNKELTQLLPGGPPVMWEKQVRSLDRENPLEKEMTTHFSILAWKIPWMEEPGRLQSTGSQKVGHDWATSVHFHISVKIICEKALITKTVWMAIRIKWEI